MTRDHDPACPLCRAEHITPWHHEDEICWIADCEVCRTPMVVWRGHGTEPPETERDHMMSELARVSTGLFGAHWFDPEMRTIPNHFHVHGRPNGAFFGPGGGPKPMGES